MTSSGSVSIQVVEARDLPEGAASLRLRAGKERHKIPLPPGNPAKIQSTIRISASDPRLKIRVEDKDGWPLGKEGRCKYCRAISICHEAQTQRSQLSTQLMDSPHNHHITDRASHSPRTKSREKKEKKAKKRHHKGAHVRNPNCVERRCKCTGYVKDTNAAGDEFCGVCGHSPSSHGESAASLVQTRLYTSDVLDLANLKKRFAAPTPSGSKLLHSWELDGSELQFLEVLGEGTSSKVFSGLYRQQEVAIKVLKEKIEPKQMEDFMREFEMMIQVRSPNIVFFYGAATDPMLCIVLERCHKGSLYDAMNSPAEADAFTWPRCLKILEHSMKGVLCLHSWRPQIVHRDLKSLNLLVDDNWNVKVSDFGTSRYTTGSGLSTLGRLRGTFAYCAPEVYFGNAFSPKSDVYSMGIVTWEVVVRVIKREYHQPYAEYRQFIFPFQIVIQCAKNDLRPTIPPSTPAPLADFIRLVWHKDPEMRPTAAEFIEKLRTLTKEYEQNREAWDAAITGPDPPEDEEKQKSRFPPGFFD